ncbi:MAG: hypothetical protein IJY69_02730 [Clostridia bacterium]|nr:hypothetical protein [Clostridia bacterium]
MKKKNLIILLLFPFLISVFCIITVNTTYNMIDVDISHIDWSYKEMEGFKLHSGEEMYPLSAVGVNQRYYEVSNGNALVWTVSNKDHNDPDPCAEIVQEGNTFYLRPIKAGEVVITCSNVKGNVQRRLSAVIYENAAIMMYPTISASQSNIDSTVYYGEYDHTFGNGAVIDMTVVTLPSMLKSQLTASHSENISYDIDSSKISIIEPGDAYLTLTDPEGRAAPITYEFKVVEGGVNVYTYEDLLYCTNGTDGGHIAVLRKHFESVENTYVMNGSQPMISGGAPVKRTDVNNVECFGYYDVKTKSFSFGDEIYRFTTTYNSEFIKQWNSFCDTNREYSKISDEIKVGLHVQKDFYGNGYTINLHNLTYPYAHDIMLNEEGKEVRIPALTSANLFRGPLKLYSLGDPSNVPLVSLYGQDNIGMYVDGNGITVNDVNIKNCDFGDRMANLDTVGTVLEVYGNNVTVKNSRLSNGKNVLRAFSSMDFRLENSLLQNARNFLFVTGSNEYEEVDLSAKVTFPNLNGGTVTKTVGEFLAAGAEGDTVVNTFIQNYTDTPESKAAMRAALLAIQDALDAASNVSGQYKGTSEIVDTYFYRSGITAICMESLFNSSFLETGSSPSLINKLFAILQSEGKSLIPYTATGVTGVAYPVYLKVSGDTRFYDYKEVGKIDLSGLIEENLSSIANSLGLYEGTITIDQIFPLQTIIAQRGNAVGAIKTSDGKRYYNITVAYYGGGENYSKVDMNVDNSTGKLDVDLLDTYLELKGASGGGIFANMRGLMLKTVVTVTGYNPFAFHFVSDGYLFGETPNVADLVNRGANE